MGCVSSIPETTKVNFPIQKSDIKLLLLGAGESGKSTIVKQMKIIHKNGFTRDECLHYKSIVFSNTLQSLTAIIRAMEQLEINFNDPDRKEDARQIFSIGNSFEEIVLSKDIFTTMQRLWNDEGVLACFKRSREYQLNDSAEYFLNSLERLAEPDYIPTEKDVLYARVKTTGIIETLFTHKGVNLRIVDVGGQRNERRKWIHCFEDVNTVIFVVAISEYDQFLREESKTNRMLESMKVFDSVCNNRFFVRSSMILFLNKKDLFQLKISSSPLSICFPEYTGNNNYSDASEYIRIKFQYINRMKEKQIYTHFTCATDMSNINHVFNVVTDRIIERNINEFDIF